MQPQPLTSHALWNALSSRFHFPLDNHHGRNTAAGREGRRQFDVTRMQCVDHIIQNSVRNLFVKDALVPKLLQIQLQAFQLDAEPVWNILEGERAEVRLSRFRADRRKLGADNFDQIVPMGKDIFKCF